MLQELEVEFAADHCGQRHQCPSPLGQSFEPDDDVGEEPGNLPLLEFVLKSLWDERRPDGEMRHEAYGAMGCLEGAIATKAEEVYGGPSALGQDAASRVFVQFVRPGAGADDTRRRARLVDIGQTSVAVAKRLADERLRVTATGGAVEADPDARDRAVATGCGERTPPPSQERSLRHRFPSGPDEPRSAHGAASGSQPATETHTGSSAANESGARASRSGGNAAADQARR